MTDRLPCEGRAQFDSYAEAQRVAKRRRFKRDKYDTKQPYKCRFCRKWHLADKER